MRSLWVKDDSGNPTHSFKDRVVAVAASAARALGLRRARVRLDRQPGERGRGRLRASSGLRSVVLIPHDLEAGKVVTTAVYGGTLVAVEGSYDDVNRLCAEVAGELPWAFVNVNVRPFYAEGSKTVGYEVAEQLGWRLPRAGRRSRSRPARCSPRSTRRGGSSARSVWSSDTPYKVFGAQSTGCSPVAAAFRAGHDVVAPVRPTGIAKSLGDRQPGRRAVRARRRASYRRGDRGRQRRRGRRRHPAAGADDRHLRRDRGRRHGGDAAQAARVRASSTRTPRRSSSTPVTG